MPTDEDLETLSHCIEGVGNREDYAVFRMRMELMGYDPTDERLFMATLRAARKKLHERRFLSGSLCRFRAAMVDNPTIGKILGLPKSTVQAIACGRLPERYTPEQRDALRRLITYTRDECDKALDDLG